MILSIGHELGCFDTYHISKTSAKVRVFVDAFKPLIVDPLIEFDSGEELVVALDYEDLQLHCSICHKLTHRSQECTQSSREVKPYASQRDSELLAEPTKEPFHQRIDRHGRPFGRRIPPPKVRGQPLKNKLIPPRSREGASPPTTQHTRHHPQPQDNYSWARQSTAGINKERSSQVMWREKVQPRVSESNKHHTSTHYIPKGTVEMAVDIRQPLGRNLALCDFPQHTIPTT